MRRLLYATAAVLFLASTLTAHAAPITETFLLSGILANTGSVDGSITIDASTGVITNGEFTIHEGGQDYTFDAAPTAQGAAFGVYSATFFGDLNVDKFVLDFATPSLSSYTGGDIIPVLSRFNPDVLHIANPTIYILDSGALAPTPEPSSLVLLGTGVLFAAGAVRRRFKAL